MAVSFNLFADLPTPGLNSRFSLGLVSGGERRREQANRGHGNKLLWRDIIYPQIDLEVELEIELEPEKSDAEAEVPLDNHELSVN